MLPHDCLDGGDRVLYVLIGHLRIEGKGKYSLVDRLRVRKSVRRCLRHPLKERVPVQRDEMHAGADLETTQLINKLGPVYLQSAQLEPYRIKMVNVIPLRQSLRQIKRFQP